MNALDLWQTLRVPSAAILALQLCLANAVAQTRGPGVPLQPAVRWAEPEHVRMLAATNAGERIVAVGDHGVILLSDNGREFRQARAVPVSSTLTSVAFVDASRGWAVGHWGVVLTTTDGGETWSLQRSDVTVDQPLFSVYFRSPLDGVAVGLWSLMLTTHDGGATWKPVSLPLPPGATKADRNLYTVFGDRTATYVTAEKGGVLKSTDGGRSWKYLETGFSGSLWSGVVLDDRVCVGGLRGNLLCSRDAGESWSPVAQANLSSSISAMASRGPIILVGTSDGGVYELEQGTVRRLNTASAGSVSALLPNRNATIVFAASGIASAK